MEEVGGAGYLIRLLCSIPHEFFVRSPGSPQGGASTTSVSSAGMGSPSQNKTMSTLEEAPLLTGSTVVEEKAPVAKRTLECLSLCCPCSATDLTSLLSQPSRR